VGWMARRVATGLDVSDRSHGLASASRTVAATMIVEPLYRGYRIEVYAERVDGF
jgi:hypothetical protein